MKRLGQCQANDMKREDSSFLVTKQKLLISPSSGLNTKTFMSLRFHFLFEIFSRSLFWFKCLRNGNMFWSLGGNVTPAEITESNSAKMANARIS